MEYKSQCSSGTHNVRPRLIIHGGAGNITPDNLPIKSYKEYHSSLLSILSSTHEYLLAGNNALDTVTFAVTQLENNPLFNSGKGAVFTRDGINELEVSVMVSRGKKKRGVGLMGLQHVKNPVKLAREMLIRGEKDLEGGNGEHRGPILSRDGSGGDQHESSGAQGHCQLHRVGAERLAREWGLDIVEPAYFFTQNRWDEHVEGLKRERDGSGQATWDAAAYVPQGTCGAVALDADGVCAVATSTGGMTNKLTGRIGDTPTLGAGFWAEEWDEPCRPGGHAWGPAGPAIVLSESLAGLLADCLPSLSTYTPVTQGESGTQFAKKGKKLVRSTAISGTGNGDSFLRINAVRTASAMARYRPSTSLQAALTEVTGPGGELVKSAGDRWEKTGEGEGGMIGIECNILVDEAGETKATESHVVYDYNCGGMFKAYVDRNGKAICRVWRPGQYDGLERYEGEGRVYDLEELRPEKRLRDML